MPRRRREIEDDFRAPGDQLPDWIAPVKPFRPEILVVPDVLANRDAEFVSVELKRRDGLGRLKITVLVENVVGRQQAFVRAPDDFPISQNGGGVAQRASGPLGIPVHVTDAQRNRADAPGGFGERGEIGLDKIPAQQQIARRVAAQEQFRREDEFRAERDGPFAGGQKFLPVGREIADGRVELEQADFHLRFTIFNLRAGRELEAES